MTRRPFPALPGPCGIILIATALVLGHATVQASPQPAPSIFLHTQPATVSKNPCGALNITNCYDAETRADLAQPDVGPYYYVYLLAYTESPINALSGLQCGLFYQDNQAGGMLDGVGVDIYSWHPCAPLEFPSSSPDPWPQPGSGNLLVWPSSACQTGPLVVAGYFYAGAYSADILAVTPRPVDTRASLANCAAQEFILPTSQLGRVAFSAGATEWGCNGCLGGCPTLATSAAGGSYPAPGNARLEILSAQPVRAGAQVNLLATSPGGSADLAIFDASGRRIRRLPATSGTSGNGLTRWDLRDDSGRTVTPGVYFIRLSASAPLVKRLVVLP